MRGLPLEAELAQLKKLVVELSRKLQNMDLPKAAPQTRQPEGVPPKKQDRQGAKRKPGGHPGHAPRLKQWLPPERVTKTVPIVPEACGHCGEPLRQASSPDDPTPTRFQVAELPKVQATITEFQGQARACACCGETTRSVIPEHVWAHSIGPALAAFMAYLVGSCSLSKRRVEELVEAVLEVPVSLGTIAHLEQEMSAALLPAHQEALAAVRAAEVKHADETGWKKAGHKRWLWVVATSR